MKKRSKILFAIFNFALFFSNYVLVAFLPQKILFGWMPSQFAFMVGSMLLAAVVWGIYYNNFFDTQEHIDKLYEDK